MLLPGQTTFILLLKNISVFSAFLRGTFNNSFMPERSCLFWETTGAAGGVVVVEWGCWKNNTSPPPSLLTTRGWLLVWVWWEKFVKNPNKQKRLRHALLSWLSGAAPAHYQDFCSSAVIPACFFFRYISFFVFGTYPNLVWTTAIKTKKRERFVSLPRHTIWRRQGLQLCQCVRANKSTPNMILTQRAL